MFALHHHTPPSYSLEEGEILPIHNLAHAFDAAADAHTQQLPPHVQHQLNNAQIARMQNHILNMNGDMISLTASILSMNLGPAVNTQIQRILHRIIDWNVNATTQHILDMDVDESSSDEPSIAPEFSGSSGIFGSSEDPGELATGIDTPSSDPAHTYLFGEMWNRDDIMEEDLEDDAEHAPPPTPPPAGEHQTNKNMSQLQLMDMPVELQAMIMER